MNTIDFSIESHGKHIMISYMCKISPSCFVDKTENIMLKIRYNIPPN